MTATQPQELRLTIDRNMTRRQTHTTSHDHHSGKKHKKKHKQIHSLKSAVILFMIVHGNSKDSGELGSNSSAQNNAKTREQHSTHQMNLTRLALENCKK
jgi:hypothetical protein